MILAYLKSIMNIIVYVMMKDKTKVNADIRQYLLSYGITPPEIRTCKSRNWCIAPIGVGSSSTCSTSVQVHSCAAGTSRRFAR